MCDLCDSLHLDHKLNLYLMAAEKVRFDLEGFFLFVY